MPRNSAGVYSLPASNPVVPFTTIATSWANPTMSDIAAELTNSLDRTGRGGMLAPFRIFDGTVVQPGLAFANEAGLGLWRSAAGTMHMASLGANVFTFEPGQATSPVKMVHYGTSQFRTTGQKWWEAKVGVDDSLTFSPSATVNAEDFSAARAIKFGSAGGMVLTGTLLVAGGINNSTLPPAVANNQIRTNSVVMPDGGYWGINLDYIGGTGWSYQSATGFGALRQIDPAGKIIDWISTVASTGVGTAATLAAAFNIVPKGIYALGVGTPNVARTADGLAQPYTLDVNNTAGISQIMLQGGQGTALKMSAGFDPNLYMDFTTVNAAGIGGSVPMTGSWLFRMVRSNGALEGAFRINPNGLVQIGDNANTYPGAITSTYKALGAWNGGLDFNTVQTVGVNPGSTATSIVMANGQVARIIVLGAGAITLPASVKLSIGSAGNFGTTATLINLVSLGGTIYATIVPF